jgi:GntR family transcriptional regulator/MocR family aminotransferase
VTAYEQLAAEGFIALKQGARAQVSARATGPPPRTESPRPYVPRFDFRPATPDLASFPRRAWLGAQRHALAHMTHEDLGYSQPHGTSALREALAEYLGRVRGVQAQAGQIVVTSGFAQARALVSRALAATGATRIAVESPGYSDLTFARRAGLEVIPIEVDRDGLKVEVLERRPVDAVMVTPAHQFPTGAVLSGERRTALLSWLRARNRIAVEDDYDSEFRYDREPVGALQGLDPERVIYAGTASKTLAPSLRLGWLVVPTRLLNAIRIELMRAGDGAQRIDQHALARLIATGEFDRHLRRMRLKYWKRRNALLNAIGRELPQATVLGVSAGLHASVQLPDYYVEQSIKEAARLRGIAIGIESEYRATGRKRPPTLLLGYARHTEDVIETGVRELAVVIGSKSATRR